MSSFKTLSIASAKMFIRNKQALFFTFFMPLVFMMVFGLIGRDKIVKMDIGVVAVSPSVSDRQFIESLKQIPTFAITEGAEDKERAALDKGDRILVLLFPENSTQGNSTIRALINEGKAPEAQGALMIMSQVVAKQALEIAHIEPSISIKPEVINARNLKYIDFLLPGLIAMAIMQMSVFSVAFVFADYRQKGVLKRLLATPLKPFSFVGANIVTRLVVSLVQATTLILIGVFVFNASVVGSYVWVFLFVILGALMFLCLGFTISSFAKTVETVPAIANLIILPMMFLGGVFFPISSFPNWLQYIAKLLPLTPFSSALRSVMIDGAGLNIISKDLGFLLLWVLALMTLATLTFKFQEKQA